MPKSNSTDHVSDEEPKRNGVSLRLVSHAFSRHPIAFIGVIFLALSAAAFVWYLLPLPKNTAAVVFHISSQSRAILAPTAESQVDFASYKQSQVALLKSRRTLNSALNDPGVTSLDMVRGASPHELTWLDKALVIDPKSGAEFMRVTIEGDDEQELLALLTAVARAYQKASHERDNGARIWRQDELEKALAAAKLDVGKIKKRIDEITQVIEVETLLSRGSTIGTAKICTPRHWMIIPSYTRSSQARNRLQSLRTLPPVRSSGGGWGGVDSDDPQKVDEYDSTSHLPSRRNRQDPARELETAVARLRQALTDAEERFQRSSADSHREADLKSAEEKETDTRNRATD